MTLLFGVLGLQGYELWIMLVGALACAAAGIIGCFLVLRKMSLMGDAISHAVLPGIVLGAWISGSTTSWQVFVGAAVFGVLTPYFVDVLKSSGRVYEDASLGIVFTILFSIGVLMVSRTSNVDLDVECILFGEIATAHLDVLVVNGASWGPRAVWILGGVLLLNIGFIVLFFKELKLMTFDPALAESMGLHPKWVHYALLALVSLTTIAAFESVGAVIVVGMLIAPGAAAYLLTDRLGVMLVLAGFVGVLCSVCGYALTMALGGNVSIAGSMATAAGLLFGVAFLFSPRYGIALVAWKRLQLSRKLAHDHLLMLLYRGHEDGEAWMPASVVFGHRHDHGAIAEATAKRMMRRGELLWEGQQLRLTPSGMLEGERLVRGHRLWEAYLEQHLGLPPDHVHRGADDIEHFLSPELQAQLLQTLEHPEHDPHGKPIPGSKNLSKLQR